MAAVHDETVPLKPGQHDAALLAVGDVIRRKLDDPDGEYRVKFTLEKKKGTRE